MLRRDVFVIGDSISMHYGPYLEKMLHGRYDRKRNEKAASADLDRPAGANGGDSSMVYEYLSSEQGRGVRHDLLLLNCGLHDIKTNPEDGTKQVPIQAYRENLQRIAELSLKTANDVVWVRTTDAQEDIHNTLNIKFYRYHRDVVDYNAAADELFDRLGIPRVDLYGFTRIFGSDAFVDHVHYKEEIRQLQAAFITGHLEALYGDRSDE